MAIIEITYNCNGCGLCVEACPMDVLRMNPRKKKAHIAYPEDCIVCFSCEMDCPEEAVVVGPERAKPMPSPWWWPVGIRG